MSLDKPVSMGQVVEREVDGARLVSMASAYHVDATNRGDVVVNGSFVGVLPARLMVPHAPRSLIGVDCGIGKDGAGIAGLWFLEALMIPAVAARAADVRLLDGADVLHNGTVSRCNDSAVGCGVREGMSIDEAAERLLRNRPEDQPSPVRPNREVVAELDNDRSIVCTDSIAYALPEDRGRNVLCTGGFAGLPNIVKASPHALICSDGGRGRDDSGLGGLAAPFPVATVDVFTARMGSGISTYHEGTISAANAPAAALGVRIGQTAKQAARILAESR